MTTKKNLILYYGNLLCEKLDEHVNAFGEIIEAREKHNLDKVEFTEQMVLKPLDMQITYLINKSIEVSNK